MPCESLPELVASKEFRMHRETARRIQGSGPSRTLGLLWFSLVPASELCFGETSKDIEAYRNRGSRLVQKIFFKILGKALNIEP